MIERMGKVVVMATLLATTSIRGARERVPLSLGGGAGRPAAPVPV